MKNVNTHVYHITYVCTAHRHIIVFFEMAIFIEYFNHNCGTMKCNRCEILYNKGDVLT